jgi:hypothetical protein
MKRVIVHIDRLALQGIAGADPRAFAGGLHDALTRVLGTADATRRFAALGAVPRLTTEPVRVRPGAQPRALGAAVARGIGRAVER